MWAWLSAIINRDEISVQEEHLLSRHILRLEREIERLSGERDYYREMHGIPSSLPVGDGGAGKVNDVKAGNVTFQRVNTGRVRRKEMLEELQTRLDARKLEESEDVNGK